MMGVPHLGFILAAYGVTAVVLCGTVLALLGDGRAQRRLLAELEPRDATRRRAGSDSGDSA